MQYFKFRELGEAPGGGERMLGFDMNVIADLEEAMGGQSIYRLMQQPSFNFVRHLAWAGLKWQDRKLTPTEVGDLIQRHIIDQGKTLESLVDPMMDAIEKAGVLGRPKKKGPPAEASEARPTEAALVAAEPDPEPEAVAAEPGEDSAST